MFRGESWKRELLGGRGQGCGLLTPTASRAEVQGKNPSQALHRLIRRTRYCGGPPRTGPPHLERTVEALKFGCSLLHHLQSGPRQRGRGRGARGAAWDATLRAEETKGWR